MPPGVFVAERSVAPWQISSIRCCTDDGHEMRFWVKDLMTVALNGISRCGASDWEFQCATDERTPDKVCPWSSPMGEVMEGVCWFRCPE